jgi:hypothetical protein
MTAYEMLTILQAACDAGRGGDPVDIMRVTHGVTQAIPVTMCFESEPDKDGYRIWVVGRENPR